MKKIIISLLILGIMLVSGCSDVNVMTPCKETPVMDLNLIENCAIVEEINRVVWCNEWGGPEMFCDEEKCCKIKGSWGKCRKAQCYYKHKEDMQIVGVD